MARDTPDNRTFAKMSGNSPEKTEIRNLHSSTRTTSQSAVVVLGTTGCNTTTMTTTATTKLSLSSQLRSEIDAAPIY